MKRVRIVVALTMAVLAFGLPPWAGAASKYNACGQGPRRQGRRRAAVTA